MFNPQQMLMSMLQNNCDPKMRSIIQNAQNPQAAVQQLCQQYPDIAKQIDGAIGQGQNPEQMVMQMLRGK